MQSDEMKTFLWHAKTLLSEASRGDHLRLFIDSERLMQRLFTILNIEARLAGLGKKLSLTDVETLPYVLEQIARRRRHHFLLRHLVLRFLLLNHGERFVIITVEVLLLAALNVTEGIGVVSGSRSLLRDLLSRFLIADDIMCADVLDHLELHQSLLR